MRKHLSYRNYSEHTVRNYVKEINHLCCYHNSSPREINRDQMDEYLFDLVDQKNFGANKLTLAIASLTYFYYNIAETPEKIKHLRSPRLPKRVPFILAPQQVYQFIESLTKLRDRVIIQLLYSTGIRVSECVKLRKQDINAHRKTIRIHQGKGQKDRYVPLSPLMMKQLDLYHKKYEPDDYIFFGRKENEPIDRTTVNRIVRKANDVLNTKELITPHTFRHSFATTLTEEGENLFVIQKVLGHARVGTTMKYLKSAKVNLRSNPLDKIYEENRIKEE